MSDIIPFTPQGNPEPEELIWNCACGCRSFILFSSGKIECANCDLAICCGDIVDDLGDWRQKLKPVPPSDADVPDSTSVTRIAYANADFARAGALKKASNWGKDGELAMVVSYNNRGASSSWFAFDNEGDKEKTIEQLERLIETVRNTATREGNENG